MVAAMAPARRPGLYVFATLPDPEKAQAALPHAIASFAEDEGQSLIVPLADAERLGLPTALPMACLTLTVWSALDGVGLTAAVAAALAADGIPANIVAAFHHDHIFVPAPLADRALAALQRIAAE